MANLGKVVYLSNEDYNTLITTGTVTVKGVTITYDENDVYLTPDTAVQKEELRDAGISSVTYTQIITFTATTAITEGFDYPYALINKVVDLDKTRRHKVVINNEEFVIPCELLSFAERFVDVKVWEYLGNVALYSSSAAESSFNPTRTDLSFLLMQDRNSDGKWELFTKTAGEYTVTVYKEDVTETELPNSLIWGQEYSPIKIKPNGESAYCAVSIGGANSASSIRGAIAIGDGNTITGDPAIAIGIGNTASEEDAIAMGFCTTSTGWVSHSTGFCTDATGNMSHTEGSYTVASGISTHAEGVMSTASGSYSHAEGYGSTASGGSASHAENFYSKASGDSSHAQGEYTEASRKDQDVSGKYNILDTRTEDVSSYALYSVTTSTTYTVTMQGVNPSIYKIELFNNSAWSEIPSTEYTISGNVVTFNNVLTGIRVKFNYNTTLDDGRALGDYSHIVGNGTANNARSNSYTLDWQGNAWYAGDIYTGSTSGTHKDSGSKKLARERTVTEDTTSTTATVSLESNSKLIYTQPLTSLTISSIADDSRIMFTTGTGIAVTVPNTVVWAVAEPVFTAGKTFSISFSLFGSVYIGEWVAL